MNNIIFILANAANPKCIEIVLIVLVFCIVNQRFLLPAILKFFHDKIEKAVNEKMEIVKKEKDADFVKKMEEKFGSALYIGYRTEKLSLITKIIGIIEIVFFVSMIYLLEPTNFLAVLGGWLGIKAAVSYDQWSHPIAGKAYFYTSLIGTLLNIGLPVLVVLFLR